MSNFIRTGEYDEKVGIAVGAVYSGGPKISISILNDCYEYCYEELTIEQTYDLISLLQEKINDITQHLS